MSFVRNIVDIEANVITLLNAIHDGSEESTQAASLVGNGRVFLPVHFRGFTAFTPSKFIGYRDNRVSRHMEMRGTRDGKDTNRELSRFLGRPTPDAELENRLRSYCEMIGVSLGNNKHSFWGVSAAILANSTTKSAIDDAGECEIGNDSPRYKELMARVYERDDRVRRSVLMRAQGRCEYQQCEPFKSKNGVPYLEAHHIVALAAQGKDTPENVIALCASHHREAHFGENWESLNEEFLKIIANMG